MISPLFLCFKKILPDSNRYKYILGAKIKTERKSIKDWILSQPKLDKQMVEYDKGNSRRLLIGYTDARAKKDAYNRDKGIRRLEKAYKSGKLTKNHINKKGYNKFLEIKEEINIAINYNKIKEDACWDGLKGYLTNTKLSIEDIYTAYHNLWNVERSFRIAKSKIEIRPMFHFTRKRIEAHICICFVVLKVYKELERMLKYNKIPYSVDKILEIAKTIITLKINLPVKGNIEYETLIATEQQMEIKMLFDKHFWVSQVLADNQMIR